MALLFSFWLRILFSCSFRTPFSATVNSATVRKKWNGYPVMPASAAECNWKLQFFFILLMSLPCRLSDLKWKMLSHSLNRWASNVRFLFSTPSLTSRRWAGCPTISPGYFCELLELDFYWLYAFPVAMPTASERWSQNQFLNKNNWVFLYL